MGRIEINGLKKFEIGEKYYFEDIGLRNSQIGFDLQRDIHKLIENAIYLHLSILQYEIYVGQQDGLEIDFVALKQGKKIYVQADLSHCWRENKRTGIWQSISNPR